MRPEKNLQVYKQNVINPEIAGFENYTILQILQPVKDSQIKI